MEESSQFHLIVNGAIEGAEHFDANNLYCRFAFTHGKDWVTVNFSDDDPMLHEGITQLAERAPGMQYVC